MNYRNFNLLEIDEKDRPPAKKCHQLVKDFFKGDEAKAKLWFLTPNPLLGRMSPNQMIYAGRVDKLLKFIENELAGNTV